jgi:serine/threonine protein kinase
MPADLKRVKEIFLAALEQPGADERQAFLGQACAGDEELRHEVEALLAQHAQASGFLESPPAGLAPTVDSGAPNAGATHSHVPTPAEALGSDIGPYKLLQKLGEGGMGTVYLAEQAEPVARRVALKIIKAGMDSAHVIGRFEQERQALAMMDHPSIAKVFDAGTTPPAYAGGSPRPYFVMELVKGIPITKFCDQEHLTPKERLELFIQVCHAVQHAHQKSIIHRDLKPSNVLIALYDGKPIAKVIDFGIAKATAQKLTERTLFTEVGQIVGTLEYMSPEQAELNNLDIDTRADIYSLGVLLYELLTGSPPFTAQQLRSAAFTAMLRMIREVEPPKPSTRLSSSDELPSIAANRKLEPARLTRLVHGDLDWIAMKCLAKERNHRYETANGLAMDIQRYLADEPVLARPPSVAYRLKKFLRRNRGSVLAGALVLLALIAGIIGTTIGLLQAQASADVARDEAWKAGQERDAARAARDEERKAKEAESVQRHLAEAARDSAANTLDAMTSGIVGEALAQQKAVTPEQKQFLTAALKYYRELLKEKASDEAARSRMAHAAFRIGAIEWRLGNYKRSAAALVQARDHYATLAREFPTVDNRFGLAASHRSLGIVLQIDNPEEGVQALRLALPIFQDLAVSQPKMHAYRGEVARTHDLIGTLRGRRRLQLGVRDGHRGGDGHNPEQHPHRQFRRPRRRHLQRSLWDADDQRQHPVQQHRHVPRWRHSRLRLADGERQQADRNSAVQGGGIMLGASYAKVTVKNNSSITGNTAAAGFGADVDNLGALYLDISSTIGILDGNPAKPI